MSTFDQTLPAESDRGELATARTLAAVYASTVLVSAFLLFQVQPLISKAILPWFGGSPAVWTTCVLFFQSLLFAGYLYAHVSEHHLGRTARLVAHLLLIGVALLLLPIAPSMAWKPEGGEEPVARILGLLAVSVGLPYLVLASTGPLVQSWFSRTFPGRSPYRLYALSNAGSLAALLSYPFLVEPNLSVGAQANIWSVGFVVFALLAAAGAIAVFRAPAARLLGSAASLDDSTVARPRWYHRVLWVLLPAFASMMLLAATNYVCQDVAVIPFLWVVPLSLYLLSFIICFDHERWYVRPFFTILTGVLILVVAGWDEVPDWIDKLKPALQWLRIPVWQQPLETNYVHELVVCFAALFGVCMVCHGELVRLKPHPKYLTGFYLWIAAGGALGGLFVTLIAPMVFKTFLEWDISLIGGYLIALLALLAPYALAWSGYPLWRAVPLAVAGVVGFWTVLHLRASEDSDWLYKSRSFYGEVTVVEHDEDDPEYHDRTLLNGTIIHGAQFVAEEFRNLPTTYYALDSGVGLVLSDREHKANLRVGTIGLGIGSVAVYAGPGDHFRFYEINPEVPQIAREYFTYLDESQGEIEIVLGDARLSMEREPPQNYDVLVMDAFSGDAIPVHLLTREAFKIYLRHLAPDGVICVHISNSYLDLAPVVRGIAEEFDLEIVLISSGGEDNTLQYNADWVLLSPKKGRLDKYAPEDALAKDRPPLLWTDDYSNLFDILLD